MSSPKIEISSAPRATPAAGSLVALVIWCLSLLLPAQAHAAEPYLPDAHFTVEELRLALKGDPAAAFDIAVAYYLGIGVEENDDQALAWASVAAARGISHAHCVAGDVLYRRDDPKGLDLLMQGATEGFAKCIEILAAISAKGWSGASVDPSSANARALYENCARLGRANCQVETARFLLEEGLSLSDHVLRAGRLARAEKWLQIAAADPLNRACEETLRLLGLLSRLRFSGAPGEISLPASGDGAACDVVAPRSSRST